MTHPTTPSRWLYHGLLFPAALFLFILPFTHTVSIRLISLLMTFLVAIWIWKQESVSLSMPKLLLIVLAVWAAWALLSVVWSVDPSYSLKEVRNEVGYTMTAFFSLYILTDNHRKMGYFLSVLMISWGVLLTWAITSWWWHGGVWIETFRFGGIATYSTYLPTIFPIILLVHYMLHASHRPWLGKTVTGIFVIATMVAGYYSMQRGFWVTFTLQIAIIFILLLKKGLFGNRSWLAWLTGCTLLVISVGALDHVAQRRGNQNLGEMVLQDVRVQRLSQIMGYALEEPLHGYGFGRRILKKAHPEVGDGTAVGWLWHAHNLFLSYMIELGIPGILALLSVFMALAHRFYLFYAQREDLYLSLVGITGMAILVGVLVRNQVNDLFIRDLALLFWALMGILLGFGQRRLTTQFC